MEPLLLHQDSEEEDRNCRMDVFVGDCDQTLEILA